MKKRFSGPQIVAKLRQTDKLLGQGKTVDEVCKEIDVTDATYYRWRQKYGGMSPDMVKQLRAVHHWNSNLQSLSTHESAPNIHEGQRSSYMIHQSCNAAYEENGKQSREQYPSNFHHILFGITQYSKSSISPNTKIYLTVEYVKTDSIC